MTPPHRAAPRPGVARAYGGVVLDGTGRLLLRAPTGGYGGYAWTLPKGRAEPGEQAERAALREVLEETGVVGCIVRPLPGWYVGDASDTRLFVMRILDCRPRFDRETAGLARVRLEQARELIGATRTPVGRRRDLAVVDAVHALLAGREVVLRGGDEAGGLELARSGPPGRRLWWRTTSRRPGEGFEDGAGAGLAAHPAGGGPAGEGTEGPFATLAEAVAEAPGWWRTLPRGSELAPEERLHLLRLLEGPARSEDRPAGRSTVCRDG